jgi:protein-L-isoaspartate(D-aspartate) O-methyltransferase
MRYWLICIIIFVPVIIFGQDYPAQTTSMVQQQIKERGIRDKRVVRAMLSVKRHEFVPDRLKHLAYQDRPLPIGHDQTISQPYIVALMTWALNPDKNDKILEVGTGSGYQAAVLAEIVDQVYSVEIVEPLGEKAKKTLQNQGYNNVHVRIGDGYKGWEKYAPFDGIIVTCSPSEVPEPLKKQLAEGGRLVIPVGGPVYQELVLYEKKKGKLVKNEISSVRFVPMLDEEGNRY